MAALRRQQEGVAGIAAEGRVEAEAASGPSWDTPAARELRTKIKSLEREARKRDIVLQVSGWDTFRLAKDVRHTAVAKGTFCLGWRGGKGEDFALRLSLSANTIYSQFNDFFYTFVFCCWMCCWACAWVQSFRLFALCCSHRTLLATIIRVTNARLA